MAASVGRRGKGLKPMVPAIAISDEESEPNAEDFFGPPSSLIAAVDGDDGTPRSPIGAADGDDGIPGSPNVASDGNEGAEDAAPSVGED